MYALGTHLLLELKECNVKILNSLKEVQDILIEAARVADATILALSFQCFLSIPERFFLKVSYLPVGRQVEIFHQPSLSNILVLLRLVVLSLFLGFSKYLTTCKGWFYPYLL